jgi:PAS domain S-box-containing protein
MPKILAIDDKMDNLVTLSALLKNLMPGCAVITAQSGVEGLGKARAETPDVVLLDVKMPEMDGFETCRRLKADDVTTHIPVIMITAVKTDPQSRIKGLECGANTFLSKPIDQLELVSQVRVALRIKKSEDDLREERNSREKAVQERADLLAAETAMLAEIGRIISSSLEINEVYEQFAAEVRKLIPFDSLMINLHDRDKNVLEVTYVSGVEIPARLKGDLIPCKKSVFERITHTRKGLILQPENAGEEIVHEFPTLIQALQAGLNSLIYVPLISTDRVIGILAFRSKKKRAYTERDLRLTERIGIQIAGAIANARLFSELKKADRSLRESEERYRRITRTITDYIYTVRIEEGRPVETSHSPGCVAVTGYDMEEFAADPYLWIKMVAPGEQLLIRDQAQRILSGTETPVIEHRIIRKDGVERWIRNTPVPHRNEEGRLTSYDGLVQDITERKQAEEENLRLAERLQRAEKMEALGTLAGGVAHDLNNVLGIVVGYAGMLLDDVDETSPIRSDLMNILSGGERAAAIVQDLLTLARRGVANRKVLNLSRFVLDCRNSPEFKLISSYHSSVQIKIDPEPNSLNISGSPVHIGKTLLNLVSNGCEAMPDGGLLTIRTANQYIDKPIHGYDEVREGDYVVLSVSDTGEGIPENDLKRIFEPFYTKKVMGRSGTGLGLSVVWGTVKDHHGYINVQSEEGKGSTFTLYFPVTREEITADQAAVPVAEYMGRGESILIVDDVKGQRELAATMLRRLNYSVTSVSGGEEAVAYLKEHDTDLMVLDMIMDPGMDGLDTYRSVLEIHPGQKAIIVSGFSESERVNAAQALGAGAYVKKPYVSEKLGLAVRKELDKFRPQGEILTSL